jgi:hypothetical protein
VNRLSVRHDNNPQVSPVQLFNGSPSSNPSILLNQLFHWMIYDVKGYAAEETGHAFDEATQLAACQDDIATQAEKGQGVKSLSGSA